MSASHHLTIESTMKMDAENLGLVGAQGPLTGIEALLLWDRVSPTRNIS